MDDSSKENVELNDFKSEEIVEAWQEEECGDDILCRACGNSSKNFIRIFEAEGIDHGLEYKINQHLPIKISEKDELPKNMCYTCASTLIAFHELVDTCIEADTKLREMFILTPKQKLEPTADEEESDKQSLNDEPFMDNESIDAGSDVDDMEDSSLKESSEILPNDESNVLDNEELSVEQDIEMDASTDPLELPSSEAVADDLAVPSTSKGFVSEGTRSSKKAATKRVKLIHLKQEIQDTGDDTVNQSFGRTSPINHTSKKEVINKKHNGTPIGLTTARKTSNSDPKIPSDDKSHKRQFRYRCKKCGKILNTIVEYRTHFAYAHLSTNSINKDSIRVAKDLVKPDENNVNVEGNSTLGKDMTTDGKFKCKYCKKNFNSKSDLVQHCKSSSCRDFRICYICGKTYSSSGYSYHLNTAHFGIKKFPCTVCGRRFAQKSGMEGHMRIHTGERPFVCGKCGKAFRTYATLYVHTRVHNNIYPFPCTMCEFKCQNITQLRQHFVKHTGEKNYVCEVCNKRFARKITLKLHLVTHNDSTPYSCQLCPAAFKLRKYLYRHMKSKHADHKDIKEELVD